MKYIAIILICVASLNPLKGYSNVDLGVHKVYSEQGLWHDLITPNIEESKEFYNKIFGWTFKEKNSKGFKYALIYNNKMLIGGMLEIPNTKSSTWITSLALSSQELNKRIKLAVANGAKLALNPIKVPGIGKQVIFEGPQGIIFSLVSVNAYNSAIVNEKKAYNDWLGIELWSDDLEKSKAFYESTFNISSEAITIDNKPYWYFKDGEKILAGMTKNPVTNQKGQWIPYVNVELPSAIIEATKRARGSVILSPNKRIRSGALGIIQDPYGAIIAVQQN